jgi:branched-chain amino acid transport system permease protein
MLTTFIQQVINGLMLGGSYALIAIGYTLIFGVLNLLHLAHGEVAMIGSYIGLTLVLTAMSQFGVLPIWVVLVGAMIGAGVVGIVVELIAFRPLGRRQLHITPLITTIAVAFVLQEAAIKLFGSEQRSFPIRMFDQLKQYDLQFGNFKLTFVQIFIIGASLALMAGLYFFVEKTTMGKAMRACAENTLTARLLGVNVHRVTVWTFGISSALAGAAGVLIGLAYNITPLMGVTLGLKGLTIMLFGGSGNIVGAMVAALILGMVETMSVAYLVPAWKDGFAFGILILILLYKPSGLFGSRLQIEAGR